MLNVGEPGCSMLREVGGSCVPWPEYGVSGQTMLLGNLYSPAAPLASLVAYEALHRVFGHGDRRMAHVCRLWDELVWMRHSAAFQAAEAAAAATITATARNRADGAGGARVKAAQAFGLCAFVPPLVAVRVLVSRLNGFDMI